MSTAARKGISAVAAQAATERVVLVSHGRAVAVVEDAERLHAGVRLMRDAALAVLDAAADKVSDSSRKFDLDTVCTRLGLDADAVRARAEQRAQEASAR